MCPCHTINSCQVFNTQRIYFSSVNTNISYENRIHGNILVTITIINVPFVWITMLTAHRGEMYIENRMRKQETRLQGAFVPRRRESKFEMTSYRNRRSDLTFDPLQIEFYSIPALYRIHFITVHAEISMFALQYSRYMCLHVSTYI